MEPIRESRYKEGEYLTNDEDFLDFLSFLEYTLPNRIEPINCCFLLHAHESIWMTYLTYGSGLDDFHCDADYGAKIVVHGWHFV